VAEKTRTQWYLGAPNAVVLCVDGWGADGFSGRAWNAYREEPLEFNEPVEAIFGMERFFDELKFPFASTTMRRFKEASPGKAAAGGRPARPLEKEKVMSDKDLLEKHGDLGTFIIRVQQRQNSSWQGRITWMDEDKSVNFRSIWEMIHLMEEAIGPEDDGGSNW